MSRRLSRRRSAPHVTHEVLVGAPELAVLALLEESLHIAVLVVRAAQPALVGEPLATRGTPETNAAARFVREAMKLERSIARYRRCALKALHDEPDRDDDLPF